MPGLPLAASFALGFASALLVAFAALLNATETWQAHELRAVPLTSATYGDAADGQARRTREVKAEAHETNAGRGTAPADDASVMPKPPPQPTTTTTTVAAAAAAAEAVADTAPVPAAPAIARAATPQRQRQRPTHVALNAPNKRFMHQLGWARGQSGAVMHADGNLRILERAVLVARQYKLYSGGSMPMTLFTDAASFSEWQQRWRDAGAPTSGPTNVAQLPKSRQSADKSVRPTDSLYLFDLSGNGSPFESVVLFENLTMPALPEAILKKASNTYRLSAHLWLKKIVAYLNAPYERSVFLDADTCPCSSLDEYFKLLDDADVVNTIEHKYEEFLRGLKGVSADNIAVLGPKPPKSFAERNCGFIGFAKTRNADELLLTWLRAYLAYLASVPAAGPAGGFRGREGVRGGDQPAYREAVYISLKQGALRERLVARAGAGAICRGLPPTWRKSCSDTKTRDAPRGVGCRNGCLAVHEKCECWSHRPDPKPREVAKLQESPVKPKDGAETYVSVSRGYERRHASLKAGGDIGHASDEGDGAV